METVEAPLRPLPRVAPLLLPLQELLLLLLQLPARAFRVGERAAQEERALELVESV